MTIARGCVLLAVFAAIALTVVNLRAEQTRSASRVLRIESDWIRLRDDLWGLQARIARMRAPDRIHDRATYLATGLVPPGTREDQPDRSVERLAANVPRTTHRAAERGSAKPASRRGRPTARE